MLSAGMADTVAFTVSFPEQRVAHTSVKMFRLCNAPHLFMLISSCTLNVSGIHNKTMRYCSKQLYRCAVNNWPTVWEAKTCGQNVSDHHGDNLGK